MLQWLLARLDFIVSVLWIGPLTWYLAAGLIALFTGDDPISGLRASYREGRGSSPMVEATAALPPLSRDQARQAGCILMLGFPVQLGLLLACLVVVGESDRLTGWIVHACGFAAVAIIYFLSWMNASRQRP